MSKARLDAYIFHTGNCREAMEFYQSVFGGELELREMGTMPDCPAEIAQKIMHAHLKGGIIDLMGSDGAGSRTEPYAQGAVTISVTGSDEAELREAFAKLAESGKVDMEIKVQDWGDLFGGLTDKYGIDWMFNIIPA